MIPPGNYTVSYMNTKIGELGERDMNQVNQSRKNDQENGCKKSDQKDTCMDSLNPKAERVFAREVMS